MNENYVYLIGCIGNTDCYVKIGMTSNIKRRLSNIQTGCPHIINEVFVILSEYREEIEGLEKLLHILLEPQRLRGEWYKGSEDFYLTLNTVLTKINEGNFSQEEIEALPDFVGPELEIMMHAHNFEFRRIHLPLQNKKDVLLSSELTTPFQISELLSIQKFTASIERNF